MKTKSISKIMLAFMVVVAICLTACQKEKPVSKTTLKHSTTTKKGKNIFILTSAIGRELQNHMFALGGSHSGKVQPKGRGNTTKSLSGDCATVGIDSTPKPYVKTWDYGTTGCTSSDGHFRSGQMTLTYDNEDIRTVNNHITLTCVNFVLDSDSISGTISLVNNGYNVDTLLTFTETPALTNIVTTTGELDTISGSFSYTWLSGVNNSPATDWQFQITGGGCMSDSYGNVGCSTIQTPIVANFKSTTGCDYAISGTILTHHNGQDDQTDDFGNPGGCSGLETNTDNVTNVQTVNQQGTTGPLFL
jgi:hypothetical protein